MNIQEMQRVSAAARLDRLPIFSFHRQIMLLLAFCFFFELGDINPFAFSAPAIRAQWGVSIGTIGFITSGTFFGMFLGAATGGWFADRVGRRRALIISVAWFSLFSLLNAVAWEPYGLFAARLLTGIGLLGVTPLGDDRHRHHLHRGNVSGSSPRHVPSFGDGDRPLRYPRGGFGRAPSRACISLRMAACLRLGRAGDHFSAACTEA